MFCWMAKSAQFWSQRAETVGWGLPVAPEAWQAWLAAQEEGPVPSGWPCSVLLGPDLRTTGPSDWGRDPGGEPSIWTTACRSPSLAVGSHPVLVASCPWLDRSSCPWSSLCILDRKCQRLLFFFSFSESHF